MTNRNAMAADIAGRSDDLQARILAVAADDQRDLRAEIEATFAQTGR